MDTKVDNFEILGLERVPIKGWTKGVQVEDEALAQLKNLASLPFIHKHVAVMPDVHWGMGATVGSVIATKGAIIPAAVGVDIGCGMMALKTNLTANDLPENLFVMRCAIEAVVPHGRTDNGGPNDRGAWGDYSAERAEMFSPLSRTLEYITSLAPRLERAANKAVNHLGTLGSGNHFVEVCLDTDQNVWVMLHSGSRGIGNAIGSHFINLAKKEMERFFITLPDANLAYFAEGTDHYRNYLVAVNWAQEFARANREVMMTNVMIAIKKVLGREEIFAVEEAVNCHHNYITQERHFGDTVWITRKGAVRAQSGDLGIIPGSMGAKSFIVRGKGNREAFNSCSHGAGRIMSRTAAKNTFSIDDHIKATEGVECRKDADVIDETPSAYKDIDAVMAAQADLVDIVYTLKQILCVKG